MLESIRMLLEGPFEPSPFLIIGIILLLVGVIVLISRIIRSKLGGLIILALALLFFIIHSCVG